MNDRDLLEAAAKAAGLRLEWQREVLRASDDGCVWEIWNPLTDDGDALRLAVKLRKFPSLTHDGRHYFCGYELTTGKHSFHAPILEPVEPDANAAIRRVIVRAAAAIGAAS